MAGAIANPIAEAVETPPPMPAPRADVDLRRVPGTDGDETDWILFDPLSSISLRLNRRGIEILSVLDGVKTAENVATLASTRLGHPVTDTEVEAFCEELRRHNLVRYDDRQAGLFKERRDRGNSTLKTSLHSYIFFRIPFWKPDRFLTATLPMVRWLGSRAALWVLALIGVLGGLMTLQQPEAYFSSFLHFFSFDGMVFYVAALIFLKLLHELGHAYIAKTHGCHVPVIGVAFIVLWPIMYTDTSDAWRHCDRRQRVWIDAGGIAVELGIAALSLFAWHFLPEGPLKSVAFLFSSITIILTLLINLNPLMKFDGYYLFSDLMRVPNLQERSFALGRWWLREVLFAYGDPAPEKPRAVLIIFAYAVWLYRFFLFLGIALIVYNFFIKAVGILLFVIEILFFIIVPVLKEMVHWASRLREARMKVLLRTVLSVVVLIGLAVVPWRSSVSIPAMISQPHAVIYLPEAAELEAVFVKEGTAVTAGDVIAQFRSPELEHQLDDLTAEIALLQRQADVVGMSADLLERRLTLLADLRSKTNTRIQLEERLKRLTLRAPQSGHIHSLAQDLSPGRWFAAETAIGDVLDGTTTRIRAMAPEETIHRFHLGQHGYFIADAGISDDVPLVLSEIAATAQPALPLPYLASTLGGDIAVRPGTNDREGELIMVSPHYEVRFAPIIPTTGLQHPRIGKVIIAAQPESFLDRFDRIIRKIAVREFSF